MSTFTYSPTYSANVSSKPKVLKAVYGDGYQQRVGNGINTLARVWSLTFVNTSSVIEAIDTFLTTENGVTSFSWTPPHGVEGNFICEEWNRVKTSYNVDTLTATFQEVFGE